MKDSRWLNASDAIGAAETQTILETLSKRELDSEIESRAIAYAMVNRASGLPRNLAIKTAIRRARIEIIRESDREAKMRRDYAILRESQPFAREDAPYYESVLPLCNPFAQSILPRLTKGMFKRANIWERLSTGTVKVNATIIADATGMSEGFQSAKSIKGKRERRELLTDVCAAFAEVSFRMGGLKRDESIAARAIRAEDWVKRGYSSREGKTAGAVYAPETRVTRRVVRAGINSDGSPSAPVSVSSGGFYGDTALSKESVNTMGPNSLRSYFPPARVKRIRNPKNYAGVLEGVRHGMSNVGVEKNPPSDYLKAKRTVSADTKVAAYVNGSINAQAIAHYPIHLVPIISDSEDDLNANWEAFPKIASSVCPNPVWESEDESPMCHCVKSRNYGKQLSFIPDPNQSEDDYTKALQRARLIGEELPKRKGAWIHPLAKCEKPANGMCRCSAKRGELITVNGIECHRSVSRASRR